MDIPEIIKIQKEGRLGEAHEEFTKLLNQFPGDRHARSAMARCLLPMAEDAAKRLDTDAVCACMEEAEALKLHEIARQHFSTRFCWAILTLFEGLKNNPETLMEAANKIFAICVRLPMERGNKDYSTLAEAFLKVHGFGHTPWLKFTDFMEWWGWENIREEDYQKKLVKSGKAITSLAERLYCRYAKVLLQQAEWGRGNAARMEAFVERLTVLQERCPTFQFTLYHKAQILLVLGRRGEAKRAALPFLHRKRNAYWVWDMMAELADADEMKLSCWCKALTCRAKAEFLVGVRLKAAGAMHRLGYDANARCELRQMALVYVAKKWPLPELALEMKQQEWYQSVTAVAENTSFYYANLAAAESLLRINLSAAGR